MASAMPASKRARDGADGGDGGGIGGGEARVPTYTAESIISFSGSAAAKRAELRAGDDEPAPAELSTVASTVSAGLRHSLRTIAEATALVRTAAIWSDWSPAAREARNRQAGHRKLGT